MEASFLARWERIRAQLVRVASIEHPYAFRPLAAGRPAAVLILIGIREADASLSILITRRPEEMEHHKGQYALPGGMRDSEHETPEATAVRETDEEMGIPPADVEGLGFLPPIGTPSGFRITPVIGLLRKPLERAEIRPNPGEVDFWFWCPVDHLRADGVYAAELRSILHEGVTREIPIDVFQVGDHRIWGATGAILRNFLVRFERTETSE